MPRRPTIARAAARPQRCPPTLCGVHPIERLRFVARAEGVPGDVLAMEATAAFTTFADDPAALVAGSRRVLSRQLGCGPLWWACARLLTADRMRRGRTGDHFSARGRHHRCRPVPVDRRRRPGGRCVRHRRRRSSRRRVRPRRLDDDRGPRWLVAGVGVHLSDPLWSSLVEHWSAGHRTSEDLVPLDRFTHFVGPDGPLADGRPRRSRLSGCPGVVPLVG